MFLINELVFYGKNMLKPEELPGCTMSPVALRKTSLVRIMKPQSKDSVIALSGTQYLVRLRGSLGECIL